MRTRTSWFVALLTGGLALVPAAVRAQDYYPPDPQAPLPLYSTRPDTGGLFVAGEFLFYRMTNPLKRETVALRGLLDFDGSITADLGGLPVFTTAGSQFIIQGIPGVTGLPHPGTFIGSGATALTTEDVRGPQTYTPGFDATIGWRFPNGVVIDGTWKHLFEIKYSAVATLVPPDLQAGQILQETFLFSPVFGFPNDFAGPPQKTSLGNPFAAYGIWNGASIEEIQFTQRYDQWDITGRIPVFQTDCDRCYGLIGPRLSWIWERFKWRTTSEDTTGQADATGVAIYSNVVSNRLYGVHVGCGNEYRLGDSPIGTFALSLDLQGVANVDIVEEVAKYERGDFRIASKRARTEFKFAPELEGQFNLWWYPIEGVQVRVGYDAQMFFNTVSSPYPIDFNYGRLNPVWADGTYRFLDGLNAGIGLIF